MELRLFNTMSRAVEPFKPLEEGTVKMYTCGPTVYNYAHIGNFRAYIFEDLLRRSLKHLGYRVVQVMNLTDVDDKTIRGSREEGVSLEAFTEKYKKAFFEDIDTLRIERAEHYPAATDHVGEMIGMITRLQETGIAYAGSDGSVYFDISKLPTYGRLSRLDRREILPGARVRQDEYGKDNASDFALWKAWDAEDGDVAWESPFGRGRPGWHIECSAMSMKYLGESFDIHTGGVDNIFPHHENEIAQSEAATGKPFVRHWLHCEYLIVEGRKMSKSLGNFYTLRDILERGYTGREVRYVLLSTHYRQRLNFSLKSLDAARKALARIDEFALRLCEAEGEGGSPDAKALSEETSRRFREALADDLNVAEAISTLFGLVKEGNRLMDRGGFGKEGAEALLEVLKEMDAVLGFLEAEEGGESVSADVTRLVEAREAARRVKAFARADAIREELHRMGYLLEDTPKGPRIKKAPSKE